MRLPDSIREALEAIAAEVPAAALRAAAADLSRAYCGGAASRDALASPAHRAAYLLVRAAATFAACAGVFEEIADLAPELKIQSFLDLGAGPGTAAWAAAEVFSSLRSITLVERDAAMCRLGQQIARASSHSALREARWITADVRSPGDITPQNVALQNSEAADLVVISYALGELSAGDQRALITRAWKHAARLLVVVEPGTPRGFANILGVRDGLSGSGGHIVAPCPRSEPHPCPMQQKSDWCHFSARLERSSLQRKLKSGELGYEDEKFSYIVFSRERVDTASARVLRHPQIGKGFVKLELCTPNGVEQRTVTKSMGDAYRAARHVSWGAGLEL